MIIIGYPLDFETLLEMFEVSEDDLDQRVEHFRLEMFYSDKGQTILGLKVPDTDVLFHEFVSVDKAIMNIMKIKLDFVDRFKSTGIDITKFKFYPMEEERIPAKTDPCIFSL